ncbi:SDR family NAD(P)-dependent oxidoreductase [Aeromicrobium sp.]|uniref:DUF7218 family protein n=1 Tax=Aeromicrobium sp. TaxID=1871063 RepID=UPI0030BFB3B8
MNDDTQAFPSQQQEPPGRTSEMDPLPDHGEASYRGSGKLQGRRALITGGDSGIGRAVALAYAREGADVAFTHMPEEQDDADETSALLEAEGRRHRRQSRLLIPMEGEAMAGSIKKPKMYEALRDEGASKEKAARISNAAAQKDRSKSSVARKGGEAGSYDDWTVSELRKRAKELGLRNYSGKKKSELVSALRDH